MICLSYKDLLIICIGFIAASAVSGFVQGFFRDAAKYARRSADSADARRWRMIVRHLAISGSSVDMSCYVAGSEPQCPPTEFVDRMIAKDTEAL